MIQRHANVVPGGARAGIVIQRSLGLTQRPYFLFFAAALGGAINAVAGGGSFVAFPALLFTGVPPIPANATNTLALWVGTTASGGAYRMKREHSTARDDSADRYQRDWVDWLARFC